MESIEVFYKDIIKFREFALEKSDLSTWNLFEPFFRKNLLLSCASLHETIFYSKIKSLYDSSTKTHLSLFIESTLKRRYHTFFDWDNGKKVNSFINLFGEVYSKKIRDFIDKNEAIKEGEMLFLELGNLRNMLVHKNFIDYSIDITIEEIYQKHQKGLLFLDNLFLLLSK
jgi:hypothetical protein